MCEVCERVKKNYHNIVMMENGGITYDVHGITALEICRENKENGAKNYLEIHVKEPGDQKARSMRFHKPILYCPFCGEKL